MKNETWLVTAVEIRSGSFMNRSPVMSECRGTSVRLEARTVIFLHRILNSCRVYPGGEDGDSFCLGVKVAGDRI